MFAYFAKSRLSSSSSLARVVASSRTNRGLSSFVTASSPRYTADATAKASGPAAAAAVVTLAAATVFVLSSSSPKVTDCHCQVPCGIFDDPVRVALLQEHAATIKKAMMELNNLAVRAAPSGEQFSSQDFNQAARWVTVKEQAASEIMDIVSTYMLAQRVKRTNFPSVQAYHEALELHHTLLQAAMKAKQTVDLEAYLKLSTAIANVAAMYKK